MLYVTRDYVTTCVRPCVRYGDLYVYRGGPGLRLRGHRLRGDAAHRGAGRGVRRRDAGRDAGAAAAGTRSAGGTQRGQPDLHPGPNRKWEWASSLGMIWAGVLSAQDAPRPTPVSRVPGRQLALILDEY